ncbi:glutamate-1-semialdehyde 2,1-aminomutase [Desulfobacterota bacterium AH_259_B03_O07]|nr:glutamate-1-semialdehyde 2,1-aminomutase [Desulfobacterota bacterium AH_259_B03_O07]
METGISNSKRLYRVAQRLMPGGVNSPVRSYTAVGGTPRFISKAKGAYVYDEDGHKYIDYMASWGPLILGHAQTDVVKAVKKATERGTSYGAPCEYEIELSNLIVKSVPSVEMVRMTNSGTEATMSAIRLARAYTGRDMIVKFEGCYHGHADYLLVKAGSGATTFGTPSSPGVPKGFTQSTLLARFNDICSVERLFRRYKNKIACVIIEPIAANMGVIPPEKDFLKSLRQITKRNGSLLVFDEVITGFRLGIGGAQKKYGVLPDITCLGKIIGGGLPVGAYGGKRNIMGLIAPVGPVYQAGTLSGNPLAMAAGIATIKKLREKGVYKKLDSKAGLLVDGIKEILKKQNIKATINSRGSMFTIFFTDLEVIDYSSALKSDTKIYSRFFNKLLDAGIMFPPSQFEAVFVSLAHTEKDIAKTLNVFSNAVKSI